MTDPVNHPKHYTTHPSGVECISVTEHMNFCRGNAMKYLWRAGEKGDEIEDLKKARWYIDREIARLEGGAKAGHKCVFNIKNDGAWYCRSCLAREVK